MVALYEPVLINLCKLAFLVFFLSSINEMHPSAILSLIVLKMKGNVLFTKPTYRIQILHITSDFFCGSLSEDYVVDRINYISGSASLVFMP